MSSVWQFISLLLALILGLNRRKISFEVATLSGIFLAVIAGCSWISIVGSYQTSGGGIPPMVLFPNQAEEVSLLFFRATVCLLAGSQIANLKVFNSTVRHSGVAFQIKDLGSRFSRTVFASLCFILIIFVLMNFENLFRRESYLFVSAGSISGAIRYLIPLIGIVSAWMSVKSLNRALHFGNYLTCILIEFSAASRSLGILLMIFFIFWATNTSSKFYFIARTSIGIYLGGIGISQALFLRSQNDHGLFPHFEQLVQNGLVNSAFGNVIGTFLVVIPVTLLGLQVATPQNYLATSFNPLPGRFTDWYEISDSLLLNPWTPTGSIAQLHNLGMVIETFAWLFFGFVLGLLGKYSTDRNMVSLVSLISVALVLSASLQILQYSVRSGVRFLYADILFLALVNIHYRRKNSV